MDNILSGMYHAMQKFYRAPVTRGWADLPRFYHYTLVLPVLFLLGGRPAVFPGYTFTNREAVWKTVLPVREQMEFWPQHVYQLFNVQG